MTHLLLLVELTQPLGQIRTNKIETVTGVQNSGTVIKFQTGKTCSIKTVVSLYHVNGMLEKKIEAI